MINELSLHRLPEKFDHFGLFMDLVAICDTKGKEVQFQGKVSLNDKEIFPITIHDYKKSESVNLNNWREVQKKFIELSRKRQHINGWYCTYSMGEDYHAHKNFTAFNGKKVCAIIARENVYVYDIDIKGNLADREDYFLHKIYQRFDNYVPLFEKTIPKKDSKLTEFAKTLFSTEILNELKDNWVNRSQFEY